MGNASAMMRASAPRRTNVALDKRTAISAAAVDQRRALIAAWTASDAPSPNSPDGSASPDKTAHKFVNLFNSSATPDSTTSRATDPKPSPEY